MEVFEDIQSIVDIFGAIRGVLKRGATPQAVEEHGFLVDRVRHIIAVVGQAPQDLVHSRQYLNVKLVWKSRVLIGRVCVSSINTDFWGRILTFQVKVSTRFDIGGCLERVVHWLLVVGGHDGCLVCEGTELA